MSSVVSADARVPPNPQAKKLVESLPQVLQKEVGKEEALRLKAVLEAAGGTVELE